MCRYTDVKRKEDRSTFIRPHEGLFGLREWIEEGVDFKVSMHIFEGPFPMHWHRLCMEFVLAHGRSSNFSDVIMQPTIVTPMTLCILSSAFWIAGREGPLGFGL